MRFPDAYIELIENYPCADKNELNRREGEFIRTMDCVNKCIAGRTQVEYHADHREERNQSSREYYADHREELKQSSREYRADHKEELKQYSSEYHAEHREELKQRHKEYNADHKEERREEAKKYYYDHKKMCICMCGTTYNSGNKQTRLGHYKSQRHTSFVADFQTRLTELLSH
jgi:glucosamine 6-phosphate synthetase-like amidotransferase/phosphosugar isomerase protein